MYIWCNIYLFVFANTGSNLCPHCNSSSASGMQQQTDAASSRPQPILQRQQHSIQHQPRKMHPGASMGLHVAVQQQRLPSTVMMQGLQTSCIHVQYNMCTPLS
jgi:hypothetical protein